VSTTFFYDDIQVEEVEAWCRRPPGSIRAAAAAVPGRFVAFGFGDVVTLVARRPSASRPLSPDGKIAAGFAGGGAEAPQWKQLAGILTAKQPAVALSNGRAAYGYTVDLSAKEQAKVARQLRGVAEPVIAAVRQPDGRSFLATPAVCFNRVPISALSADDAGASPRDACPAFDPPSDAFVAGFKANLNRYWRLATDDLPIVDIRGKTIMRWNSEHGRRRYAVSDPLRQLFSRVGQVRDWTDHQSDRCVQKLEAIGIGKMDELWEAVQNQKAGFDEGILSLSLPIIVYIENFYMDKNYSDCNDSVIFEFGNDRPPSSKHRPGRTRTSGSWASTAGSRQPASRYSARSVWPASSASSLRQARARASRRGSLSSRVPRPRAQRWRKPRVTQTRSSSANALQSPGVVQGPLV
jgi:hypothetical protein